MSAPDEVARMLTFADHLLRLIAGSGQAEVAQLLLINADVWDSGADTFAAYDDAATAQALRDLSRRARFLADCLPRPPLSHPLQFCRRPSPEIDR